MLFTPSRLQYGNRADEIFGYSNIVGDKDDKIEPVRFYGKQRLSITVVRQTIMRIGVRS